MVQIHASGRAFALSTQTRTARAKLAAAARHYPNHDHTDLQRELAAAKLEEHVRKVVDSWPPLTKAQRDRLAVLLQQAGGETA